MSVKDFLKISIAPLILITFIKIVMPVFVALRNTPFAKEAFLAVAISAASIPWYTYLSTSQEKHYIELLVGKEPDYAITTPFLIQSLLLGSVLYIILKAESGLFFGLNTAILLLGLSVMSFSLTRLMRMYHCLIARIDNKLDLGDATSDEKILERFYGLSGYCGHQTGFICVFGFIAFAGFFFFGFIFPYISQYNKLLAAYFILAFFIILNYMASANRTIVTNVITFMTIMKCDAASAERERLRELLRGQLTLAKGMAFMYLVLCVAVFYMISALM